MQRKFALCAIALLGLLPLFVKLPAYSLTWMALNNSAHSVLFLLLVLGFAFAFKLPHHALIRNPHWRMLWAALSVLGIAIECVQAFIGRSSSIYDVMLDVIGIVAGSLFYCGCFRQRLMRWGQACLLLTLAFVDPLLFSYRTYLLQKQLPVICNFDGPCPWALGFNLGGAASPEAFQTIKPHQSATAKWPNNHSEFASLNYPAAPYPGMGLQYAFVSWQGYRELCAEIYWPYLSNDKLGVHIHDAKFPEASQKFEALIDLSPGSNTVCVDLRAVERVVNLDLAKTLA